jgi:hypothetical protein
MTTLQVLLMCCHTNEVTNNRWSCVLNFFPACECNTIPGPKIQNFQCPRHSGCAAISSEFLTLHKHSCTLHKHSCERVRTERERNKKKPTSLPLTLSYTLTDPHAYTHAYPAQVSLGNDQHQTVDQGEALFFEMDSVLTTLRLEVCVCGYITHVMCVCGWVRACVRACVVGVVWVRGCVGAWVGVYNVMPEMGVCACVFWGGRGWVGGTCGVCRISYMRVTSS